MLSHNIRRTYKRYGSSQVNNLLCVAQSRLERANQGFCQRSPVYCTLRNIDSTMRSTPWYHGSQHKRKERFSFAGGLHRMRNYIALPVYNYTER